MDPRDEAVTFDGFTGPLLGLLRRPDEGAPKGILVLAHGRNADRNEPLLVALAGRSAVAGFVSLRFNFAFQEANAEPSAGHEDEIADLRAAIAYGRQTAGGAVVTVVGRGLGAWATVACVTDEDAENAILLGLAYTGQPERRMALERLAEFEIPTLIFIGSASDRVDVPGLKALVDPMPFIQLEIIEGADHRLKDPAGRTMTEHVIPKCEAWLRAQTA